jgi:ADP-ribose pyrophosphatase YjhB (NUDIX family)
VSGGEMAVDGTENSAQAFFAPEEIPWGEMPDFYVAMVKDAITGRQGAFAPPYAGPRLTDLIGQLRACVGQEVIVAGGAVAVIVDAQQRLLVVKRTDDGEWSLPGGFTHLGENIAHTAVREILEETGLHIVPERILGISSLAHPWIYPNGDQAQVVGTIFLAKPAGGVTQSAEVPRPDLEETSQVGWVTVEEFLALEVNPVWLALHRAVADQLQGAQAGAFVV